MKYNINYPLLFVIVSGAINFLLVLYHVGYLKTKSNAYIDAITLGFRLFIGILLVITYNPIYPLRKRFKELDDNVVFSAGMYILFINAILAYQTYIQT